MGGAFFQPLIGRLLDWHASGALNASGLPIYTTEDYLFALAIIPIGVATGGLLCLFLKETYCKSQVAEKDSHVFSPSTAAVSLELETAS